MVVVVSMVLRNKLIVHSNNAVLVIDTGLQRIEASVQEFN